MPHPLLLVTDSTSFTNRYGPYVAEMLRAEGLHGFKTTELADLAAPLLAEHSVVILTRSQVTEKTRDLFGNYVAAGGQLILLMPESIWEPLTGMAPLPAGMLDGYLKLLVTREVSQGFPAESFQFHGPARYWSGAGAQPLALLYRDAVSPTSYPAIAYHTCGQGRVITFAFDPAESVATTRQGNPRCAGTKWDDTNNNPRPGDLFGAGWIDVAKEYIPQADALQALLARLVERLSPVPLPRLWYLPGMARTLLLLTGDGEGTAPADFRAEISAVERYGGHISFYDLVEKSQLDPAEVAGWRGRGHGFGLHPWAGPYPTTQLMRQELPRQEALFRQKFGHPTRTYRCHWLQWCGYVEQARLLAQVGIRMDTNFTSSRPSHGQYLTGSGRAMRFVSESGEILPVWQQPTQLEDDIMLRTPGHSSNIVAGQQSAAPVVDDPFLRVPRDGINPHTHNMTAGEAVSFTAHMLTTSMERYYTPITLNVHPPFYTRFSGPWLDGTLAFARQQEIPIWCAEEWLDFTEARDGAQVADVAYADGQLRFSVAGGPSQLTVCLPVEHGGKRLLEVRCGGQQVEFQQMEVQRRAYAFIPAGAAGRFEVLYST
ncbi:MAG: hypothetical protein EXR62_17755 [Chloroflexi bacterium]|nr:hypothetical protein [Chloroflexota bacterium]